MELHHEHIEENFWRVPLIIFSDKEKQRGVFYCQRTDGQYLDDQNLFTLVGYRNVNFELS